MHTTSESSSAPSTCLPGEGSCYGTQTESAGAYWRAASPVEMWGRHAD